MRRQLPIPRLLSAGLATTAIVAVVSAYSGSPAAQSRTAPTERGSAKGAIRHMDRAEARELARGAGYRARGGVEKAKSDSHNPRFRSLPHFSSSFTYKGTPYLYTMLGNAPASGNPSQLRTIIIPLRMQFRGFEQDVTFDPAFAVRNILRSPIYQEAQFPTESGQFADVFQRATFWNKMDRQRRWHTTLARPKVAETIDIQVTPGIGELIQLDSTTFLGTMNIDALDSQLHTIVQLMGIDPDETPLFITQNAFADVALGYHDAYAVDNDDDSETLQTLMFSSWLDPNIVGDLLGDISTLNHEVAEWYDDPFVNNIVPLWAFPPHNLVCGDNPYLEVGDPQGNGPDYALFPTYPVTMNNFTYHLQGLVMLPWFAREAPSSAVNRWYSFPDPTQIVTPSVACK